MTQRISTPQRTREIIAENQFTFKKNFGQNFLIDTNILESIAEHAQITKEDCILEIGPGIGSLTEVLAEYAREVVAVEIDKTLIPILEQTLSHCNNITLINQDILKTDIESIIEEKNSGNPIKVIANLPYYITTPIIMGLLEKNYPIDSITVMVQKEVAERMESAPNTKEYGALSVAVQYYCDTAINLIVPPSSFMPQPKIASAVITLKTIPNRKIQVKNEQMFFHVVKCAFGQRRKTLLNTLFNQGNFQMSKEEFTELIENLGWDARVRGETLSIQQFGQLADALYDAVGLDCLK